MSQIDTLKLANAAKLIMEYEKRPTKADEFLETKYTLSYKYGEERRICQFIFLTVLRNKLIIEAILAKFLKKKPRDGIFCLLKAAAAEILTSDEQKYPQIIHAWVETAKKHFSVGESKLANAVLRKFAPAYNEFKANAKTLADFALLYSHPLWIAESWQAQFGTECAIDLMKIDNIPSDVFFRLSPLQSAKIAFAHFAENFEKTEFENFYKLKSGHFQSAAELLATPYVYIQDPATRLAPLALDPSNNCAILDLCAAPGGKSRAIADLLHAKFSDLSKARIVAVDIDSARFKRLTENLAKIENLKVDAVKCDLMTQDLPQVLRENSLPDSYEYILLDAPCSNSGVLRRRPDARYRLAQKDIENCRLIQIAFIKCALKLLKAGGRLVYSTCSIDRTENLEAPAEALLDFPDCKIISAHTELPSLQNDGAGVCVIEKAL